MENNMKLFVVALVLALVNFSQIQADGDGKLEVKVYYETLCPDSMQFIRGPLYNAMVNNGWLENTDLKFVPYGKVTAWTDPTTGVTSLACQHGARECENNALHACIVENYNIEQQMQLIYCLMSFFNNDIDKCGSKNNIDVSAAKTCKATRETPEILKKYGEDTATIDITFVPSIAMDGKFDRSAQNELLYKFEKTYCSTYKAKFGVTLKNC